MSRNSTERVSEEEKLLNELVEKLAKISPLFVEDRNLDLVIKAIDEYVDEKAKLNEGDKYMPCVKCHKEFEWNGKDLHELTLVRGHGLFCKECMRQFFMFSVKR